MTETVSAARIALAEALWRAGWIDRGGRVTNRLPVRHRVRGTWGTGIALSADRSVALWERRTKFR